jgi:hypothetical protein
MYPICVNVLSMLSLRTAINMNAILSHVGMARQEHTTRRPRYAATEHHH